MSDPMSEPEDDNLSAPQTGASARDELSEQELAERVIYALFLPSVRLARAFGADLSRMKEWVEMAYFHELRREGLKMREVADVMGVSTSKASLLSRQLKENFARSESEHELPRRIEFMLWAEPLSRAKIHQVLGRDFERRAIDRTLRSLAKDRRIRLDRDTSLYGLVIQQDRRVWDSWVARVDGLKDVLGTLTDVIYGRFFRGEPRATARTLSFRIDEREMGALAKLYEEVIFARIVELDERAGEAEQSVEMNLSLFWSPRDLLRRALRQDD